MAKITDLSAFRRPQTKPEPSCARGCSAPCASARPSPQPGPLPETLDDLRARIGTQQLDLDLSGLALLGTLLDGAQVLTRNSGALIVGKRGYAGVQTAGSPFRGNRQRPVVRMAPATDLPVLLSAADGPRPPCLSVTCGAGRIAHRVQLMTPADQAVAASVPAAGPADRPAALPPLADDPAPRAADVVRLDAIRAARQLWPLSKVSDHLDDLLADRGRARGRLLPLLGASRALRVRHDLIPSLLRFISRRGLSFSITVPTDASLSHSLTGRADHVDHTPALLSCRMTNGFFSLDLAELAQAWVSRYARAATGALSGAMLDLYGRDGRCMAVLHADPFSSSQEWADVLEALTTG